MARALPFVSALLLGACSVVGVRSGTEEPRYRTVDRIGAVEIREYGPRIAAETTVEASQLDARSEGFTRIARYIFGGNTAKSSIAMTAPVAQASASIAMTAPVDQSRVQGGWTIRFFMPAQYTLDTLPVPNDPSVHLVGVPAQTMAVLRFTGARGPEAIAQRQAELMQALAPSRWRIAGAAVAWFYDPPWTLFFLRRNEVAFPVVQERP